MGSIARRRPQEAARRDSDRGDYTKIRIGEDIEEGVER